MYRRGDTYSRSINITSCNINGALEKGTVLTSTGETLAHMPVGTKGQVLVSNPDRDVGMSWEDTDIDQHVSNQLEKLDTYMYKYELDHLSEPTMLSNQDFIHGTYRIRESGVYKLSESILFNPNADHDHKPTTSQVDSGQYPVAPHGPYHMGFFAAITIEVDHVVLDLNGFRIDQHISHQLQQRFYSAIELGSSPFIPKQGPSNFGEAVSYPSYTLIKNGTLGRSSHHGIHGNNTTNLILQDLEITDFEQAGWGLNGCSHILMRRIHVHSNIEPPVSALYSHARFLLPFLNTILAQPGGGDLHLDVRGEPKTGTSIKQELVSSMDHVFGIVGGTISGEIGDLESARIFTNTGTKLDGNVYGGVFHAKGVSVNEFLLSRSALTEESNHTMVLDNVTIDSLTSTPREVIGLQHIPSDSGTDASHVQSYGLNVQKGPVGDVFDVEQATSVDGTYLPNVVSNAQLFLAKHGVGPSQRGGTNIHTSLIDWASTTNPSLSITTSEHYKTTCGGDSMAHVMKGNIGLFLSGVTRVVCNHVSVMDVSNRGQQGLSDEECYHHTGLLNDHIGYQGSNTRGIASVSSSHCYFKHTCVKKINSKNGYAIPVDYLGENKDVVVHSMSSS